MKAVVVGLVLVSGLSGLSGCSKPSVPSISGKTTAVQPKVMTREEFDAKIKGLTTAKEIFSVIGQPFETGQADSIFNAKWKGITKDAITGKEDYSVTMVFNGTGADAVYYRHQFHP